LRRTGGRPAAGWASIGRSGRGVGRRGRFRPRIRPGWRAPALAAAIVRHRRKSTRPVGLDSAATRGGGRSAARTDPRKRQNPGDDLCSRKAALSVSSALESLTSVFGMGTGVASPPESPGFCLLDVSARDGSRDTRRGNHPGSKNFDLPIRCAITAQDHRGSQH
jgi:hypothetical protein